MSQAEPTSSSGSNTLRRALIGANIVIAALIGLLGVVYVLQASDLTLSWIGDVLFTGATIALPVIGRVTIWVIFLVIAGIGALVVMTSTIVEQNRSEDADGPRLPALQNAATVIQALAGGTVLVTLWFLRDAILERRWTILVGLAILFASWIIYVYLSNRQSASRRSTAIRRTQRNVGNSVENWAEALLGAVFVVAAIGLSVLSAGFQAFGSMDQFITPILNEAAFWAITALGYIQLGGDRIPGSQFVPELNALQWVGIAALLFAAVVVFRD